MKSCPCFSILHLQFTYINKSVIHTPQNLYNFVIGVVFSEISAYNKNVIEKH